MGQTVRSSRWGGAVVVTIVAVLISACGGGAAPTPVGASAPGSSAPASSADPTPAPSVTPRPPASYQPAAPGRTARTDAGYLVDTCVPRVLWSQVISLVDVDGTQLSGLVLGTGTKGVLLAHEQGYSICSFLDLGRKLADLGYLVMIPEFRNHGASESVADNEHIDRDVDAALAELHRRGAIQVFLGGASCGGTTATIAGAKDPSLVGLLIMSSPARCGPLDAVGPIRTIHAPSLFIVSPGDMNGAVEKQVRELYAASGAPDKRLIIDDSGYHGTDLLRRATHRTDLEADILRLIAGCFLS